MKNSQKLIFSCLVTAIILAFAATAVLAQETTENTLDLTNKLNTVGGQAGFAEDTNNLPELIGRVVQIFLSILGLIFMGYIVYAGSLWIIARGDQEKITKSKDIIRGSVIGLVIVFAAYAITFLVVSRLVDETGFTK